MKFYETFNECSSEQSTPFRFSTDTHRQNWLIFHKWRRLGLSFDKDPQCSETGQPCHIEFLVETKNEK